MTRAESIAILKDLLTQTRYYAQDTDSHIGSPMALNPFAPAELRSFTALADSLNFETGSGRQVADGTFSWKTWAGQLQGIMEGMVGWRSENGYPPLTEKDPLAQWVVDVAAPQLSTLAVGEFITQATEPARQAASAAAGVLEYGTPFVVAVVVILVLVIVVHLT